MTYRTAAVLILTSLAPKVSHAQVDSFGGSPIKPWGIWRPLSPKSPYLESRSIRTSSLTAFLPPNVAGSREPLPVEAGACSMPSHHCSWRNENERLFPARPEPSEWVWLYFAWGRGESLRRGWKRVADFGARMAHHAGRW